MDIKNRQLVMYWSQKNVYYMYDLKENNDPVLCRVEMFLQGLPFAYYEKMLEILEIDQGLFSNTVEGVQRINDRICLVTYYPDFENRIWLSYSSFLMLIDSWKAVKLFLPAEIILHRLGEEIWITFEKTMMQKAYIKNSLKGYYLFVSTSGDAKNLALALLQGMYELSRDIVEKNEWKILEKQLYEFKKRNYFGIFLEKKNKWYLFHSNSIMNQYGEDEDVL